MFLDDYQLVCYLFISFLSGSLTALVVMFCGSFIEYVELKKKDKLKE